jgi:phospholipase/carboxylesterase
MPVPPEVVYVDPNATAPRPLFLLLHGAGGKGERIFARMRDDLTTVPGLVVVAPDSRGRTWDIAESEAGPDVQFIDNVLRGVFAHYAIDGHRIAVAGFSDGASYALALGLTNGDLFTHVMAFSPGFLAVQHASPTQPRVFIAHGRSDDIIPFEHGGQQIAAQLRDSRYDVTFRPFDDGHTVRHEVVAEAMKWWSLPR